MSIPLDRLYHYIESLSGDNILIYRWFPHGSKKLEDLKLLNDKKFPNKKIERILLHNMICHDQEPLDYNYYSLDDFMSVVREAAEYRKTQEPYNSWCYSEEFLKLFAKSHFRTKIASPTSLHDLILLCHSEKNSDQLDLFERNGFVGVYYWSHALIARDWFRYAEYDKALMSNINNIKTDFLIYNRAWAGTREYRLKFTELIADAKLVNSCNVKFNAWDNDQHYKQHKFKNNTLQISRNDLEELFELNTASSQDSADYNSKDYAESSIEVVLETLFDDCRNHLTEKTLRPIACGKPFIVAASPGTLKYLKSYGFKTFDGMINEAYDTIRDPLLRLQAIVAEMSRLAALPTQQKFKLWQDMNEIASYNKQLFFSQQFHDQVVSEFNANLTAGIEICNKNMKGKWWKLFTDGDMLPDTAPTTELSLEVDRILQGTSEL